MYVQHNKERDNLRKPILIAASITDFPFPVRWDIPTPARTHMMGIVSVKIKLRCHLLQNKNSTFLANVLLYVYLADLLYRS